MTTSSKGDSEKRKLTHRITDSIKMALLQNPVKEIPDLSIVEALDEYISTTNGRWVIHSLQLLILIQSPHKCMC